MDGSRFDQLARSLAGGSRRSLIKVAFGGALALAGAGSAEAAAYLRADGEICRKDGDCASGVCGAKDSTGRQRCQTCRDPEQVVAPHVDPTTSTLETGCCLPAGATIPGGCSFSTIYECCADVTGGGGWIVGCTGLTNTCITGPGSTLQEMADDGTTIWVTMP